MIAITGSSETPWQVRAKAVRPRVILLENVQEFQDWGPLDDDGKPDPAAEKDDDFDVSGVRDVMTAARPIYQLHDAAEHLVAYYPPGKHAFPPEANEDAFSVYGRAARSSDAEQRPPRLRVPRRARRSGARRAL